MSTLRTVPLGTLAALLASFAGCSSTDAEYKPQDSITTPVRAATPGEPAPDVAATPGIMTPGVAAPGVAAPGVAAPGVAAPPAGEGNPNVTSSGITAPISAEPGEALLIEEPPPVDMEPKECVGTVMETETLVLEPPVTMYLVLDNSKSMREDPVNGKTKWEQAVAAFTEFVRDPESEGIGLGIQYFHPQLPAVAAAEAEAIRLDLMLNPPANDSDECIEGVTGVEVCGDRTQYRPDKCDGMAHAQSATEVGRIPAVTEAVVESLESIMPNSNTPTVGALTGGVDFCAQFHMENPDEQCVVVFVTDGQPNGCGLDLGCHDGFTPNEKGQCVDPQSEGVLSPIVQEAHDESGVLTYTVGMEGVIEDGFDLLDQLAILGGTDCTPDTPGDEACDVTESGTQGLLEALNGIRDEVVVTIEVPCAWDVPEPPNGQLLDPELVNIALRLKADDPEEPLPQVPSAADCAAVADGWYYDDPLQPSQIHACPQTCTAVEEHSETIRVSLSFGCATRKAIVQ